MTKKKIMQLISEAASDLKVANVFMVYNENCYHLIPLKASDRLFLAINENDFIFDGFRISRFRDVKEVHIRDRIFDDIIRREGLLDDFTAPEINVENWQTVFENLKKLGKNIIVEYETPEGKDDTFSIGKIDKVYKNWLYLYVFDADGIWDEEPYRIQYTEVTSVTFESRYVSVFTKYISGAPI